MSGAFDDAALAGAELLARAQRAFGPAALIAETLPRRKAIVAVGNAAEVALAAEVDEGLAQAAIDKLRDAEPPTAEELAALEACIRFMRPAWLVRRDRIFARVGEGPAGPMLRAIEPLLAGVGCILRRGQRQGIATGFLVAPRALVTSAHVLRQLSPNGSLAAGDASAQFGLEADEIERHAPVPIAGVSAVHPSADVVVLALAADGPHAGLPVRAGPAPAAGAALLVVGYPRADERTPLFASAVYADLYGVKRAAPGEVTGGDDERLFHDASTLGGNSGSPVLDLETAAVVGVHATGHFAHRNEAIRSSVLAAEGSLRPFIGAIAT